MEVSSGGEVARVVMDEGVDAVNEKKPDDDDEEDEADEDEDEDDKEDGDLNA